MPRDVSAGAQRGRGVESGDFGAERSPQGVDIVDQLGEIWAGASESAVLPVRGDGLGEFGELADHLVVLGAVAVGEWRRPDD